MSHTPRNELVHFLSDLYSMELQALAQLVTAPGMTNDPTLASDFKLHHAETERQAERVRARLEALGGAPSAIKDAVMKLGGKALLLFAKLQPETPGKLIAHAYSYEAMEWAAYAHLIHMAERLDDTETAEIGRSMGAEERRMMQRLEKRFDAAETASHRETPLEKMGDHIHTHLTESHALAVQSVKLL